MKLLGPGFLHGGEDANRLHNILGSSITPFDIGGISVLKDADGFPVIDKFAFLSLDCAVEHDMGRVILKHVDHLVEVNEGGIDGNNIHFARKKALVISLIYKLADPDLNPGPLGEQSVPLTAEPSFQRHRRISVVGHMKMELNMSFPAARCQKCIEVDNESRNSEQFRYPSTDEWIMKMWYIYMVEYYSAAKKYEIMKLV
ncbi:hypothetical protein STEG23_012092, partial [Scotinomys teguina]